jgi:hypothetical protein
MPIDTADEGMGRVAVMLLALFAEMERTPRRIGHRLTHGTCCGTGGRLPNYEADPATVPMERRPAACMSRVLAASVAIGIIHQPRLGDAPVAGLAAASLGSAQRRRRCLSVHLSE